MSQLWVGSTELWESEDHLMSIIRQLTSITPVSCWFCRNKKTGQLSGFGFIDFRTVNDAATVFKLLCDAPIPNFPDKRFRLKWGITKSDADLKVIQQANGYSAYVGNLPVDVNEAKLLNYFRKYFPKVISAKLIKGIDGISKGYGFVKFNTKKEVDEAIRLLNGSKELGNGIKVNEASGNRINLNQNVEDLSNTTLFIKDIDPEIVKEETLMEHFRLYGNVLDVKIIPEHPDWANVIMETHEQAESAKNALQGKRFGGTSKCQIQFGLPTDNEDSRENQVVAPVVKPPKKNKKLQAKFFDDAGINRVLDIIEKFAESNRFNSIMNSDHNVANRIYESNLLKNEMIMDINGYSDFIPSTVCNWYY